jgi:DNA-binding CsgD family transcriptional regulator
MSLGAWYLWRGEHDPARDLLNTVIAVSERHGSDRSAAMARINLMEVEWRAGHWDAAAAHAAAYNRWSRETGHPAQGLPAYVVSLIEAGRGHIDQARERAAAGVERADAQRDMMYSARRLPFELGRCLLVLGTAQRKARQRRDAAASLEEAIAIFGGLGAPRWQVLAAAQRARLAPGPDQALTATERRIADLVAAGQTNPEIAAALYVSVKSVEANLTRIYRKLGLRGRVDLARRGPA